MKFIKLLPYDSIMDGWHEQVGLWKGSVGHCEMQDLGSIDLEDVPNRSVACDNSGYYYGTDDEYDPKFCSRHFYQEVVSGDGKSNYALIDKTI